MTTPLIDPSGQVPFGRFAQTLHTINGRQADYLTAMGKPASRFARHFDYKQFQYFGVISKDFLMGCAFADTAWLGLAFFYFYDNASSKLSEWTWRSPFGKQLTMSDSPRQGSSLFRLDDQQHLAMEYQDTDQGLIKTLTIKTANIDVQARLLETPNYQPMSICTRTGISGFTYANKVAGVAANGYIRLGDTHYRLDEHDCHGHHDFTAGYLRRETFWNWACTSARVDNHQLGLNLSCGVNETSASENCLWLDGRLHPVAGIFFDYNRKNLFQPWRIHDKSSNLELTFTPQGRHQERLNLALFASNFNQLFGHFNGHVTLEGKRLSLHQIPGFVEEQYAKW